MRAKAVYSDVSWPGEVITCAKHVAKIKSIIAVIASIIMKNYLNKTVE